MLPRFYGAKKIDKAGIILPRRFKKSLKNGT